MTFHIRSIRDKVWTSQFRFGSSLGRSRRHSRRLLVEGLESRCLLSLTINEFPVPTVAGQPFGITAGPDSNLWFTEFVGNQIGQLNPTTHAFAEFPIPSASSAPFDITAGSDGNLW